ncbi:hypothetical protein [Microaceticoccus formicicus]|uniref:hypothetical protein n=1 Tax=Microaceticoccus formicicus TaxID=3118105 RepID=UPI003CD00F39|nr:zinc ribbon domain-containing protein [Peptoniphilaceae bacterium AMB_02]
MNIETLKEITKKIGNNLLDADELEPPLIVNWHADIQRLLDKNIPIPTRDVKLDIDDWESQCPVCDEIVDVEAKYCAYCGQAVEMDW